MQVHFMRKNSKSTMEEKAKTIFEPLHFRRHSTTLRIFHYEEVHKPLPQLKRRSSPPSTSVPQILILKEILKRKNESTVQTDPVQHSSYQYYDSVVKNMLQKMHPNVLKSPKEKGHFRTSVAKMVTSVSKMVNSVSKIVKKTMTFSQPESTDNIYEKKIAHYIEFLYQIAFSNGIHVDLSLTQPKKMYRVYVGGGNNSLMIRSLLNRRFWLAITNDMEEAQFVWTQGSIDSLMIKGSIDSLMSKKHIDSLMSKGSIDSLMSKKPIDSLMSKGVDRVEIQKTHKKEFKQGALTHKSEYLYKIVHKSMVNVTQSAFQSSKKGMYSMYETIVPKVVTNHIPSNYVIGCKKNLFLIVKWYYEEYVGGDPYQVIPKTYNVKTGMSGEQCAALGLKATQIYIVKPGQNTNRGNGIQVAHASAIPDMVCKREYHRNGQLMSYVIQQYIEPLLYHGRKFDMRHYMLMTNVNGCLKAYWYKEGYVRTSALRYDRTDLENEFVHLTNDAIQKQSDHYGKYEQANKLSYNAMQRYFDAIYPHHKYSFKEDVVDRMKQITIHLIRGGFQFMKREGTNFQLFGLDFMLDRKMKVYLIECNANPCLEVNCPLLQRIIPIVVEHTLRVGLDPLLPPPQHFPPNSRYNLSDRVLEKLNYEIIFDQRVEGEKIIRETQGILHKLLLSQKNACDTQIFEDEGKQYVNKIE